MKNSERPAWIASSRRAKQQPQVRPQAPADPKQQPAHTLQLGPPAFTKSEVRRAAKGSARGYNPYDTVATRLPDVWHSKPKRS